MGGVLRVTINHGLYLVMEEMLHQILDACGVEEIIMSLRAAHVEAVI